MPKRNPDDLATTLKHYNTAVKINARGGALRDGKDAARHYAAGDTKSGDTAKEMGRAKKNVAKVFAKSC